MKWLGWAAAPILISVLWLYTSFLAQNSFPMLAGKRILLLIAHPDDEAMFFAPTLLALTNPALQNHVRILCLSTGNADGLGETRKKELVASGLMLGIEAEDSIEVLDDTKFPDSMSAMWDAKDIVSLLTNRFVPHTKTESSTPPKTLIDAIITFDEDGISSHPNHRSLYIGAKAFVASLMQPYAALDSPIAMYTLKTTNVLRKYLSILDAPWTIGDTLFTRKATGDFPTPMFFVSWPKEYRAAQLAMTSAHKSQMRWFRWGWITLSRYMILNDIRRENI